MPPQFKIAAAFLFICVVVSTSITNVYAFAGYFLLVALTISLARLPWITVLRRSFIEIPFVLFAFLMPFFGRGERIELLGLSLYADGLLAGAGIIAKGTLGILTAIVLSASTTARELLRGLEKLKLPSLLIQIATFMLRYLNVVNDEMQRMKIARASRGFEATGIRHWRVLAHSAGALFIRSYERGERVHLAMVSRGYAGLMPEASLPSRNGFDLWRAMSLPILALLIHMTTRLVA